MSHKCEKCGIKITRNKLCKLCLENAIYEDDIDDALKITNRPFSIKPLKNGGLHNICEMQIDGKTLTKSLTQFFMDERKSFYCLDIVSEIANILVEEINLEFNLTNSEKEEYTKLITTILKD